MARVISVNVGVPRDVEWKGRIVRTAIWKYPVNGSCRVHRLNLEGDRQADLLGHGGEQRAVFVYQIESYRYWQKQLSRADFVHGQFGENLTIEGLPDDVVCIGDRFKIGSALFEVTQPRVTCYRVGIRTDEPRMPALLTSSGRPGFYFRVLREGAVQTGDEILKVGVADVRMTVAEINGLLYSSDHPRDRLSKALEIEALSPGWRASFEALLNDQGGGGRGNAGLMPKSAGNPASRGFRPLKVAELHQESEDVLSIQLRHPDGEQLPLAQPGQYIVLRLKGSSGAETALLRSYSVSGPASVNSYRVSVKIRANGAAGAYLRKYRVGDLIDVSAPRGSFVLQNGERPILLISAGIGCTPVLAMLHALATAKSKRTVHWLHVARDGQHHPFAAEVGRLISMLPSGRSHIFYSSPGAGDVLGRGFDHIGRLSSENLKTIDIEREAEAYLCGPTRFMTDAKEMLSALVDAERIYFEKFSGGASNALGSIGAAPHPPQNGAGAGLLVSFVRSGVVARWNASTYHSILELAEACDVPVRWSCRAGVCHNCECGLVAGSVVYEPQPLDPPADGNLLICCSRPSDDIVVDL